MKQKSAGSAAFATIPVTVTTPIPGPRHGSPKDLTEKPDMGRLEPAWQCRWENRSPVRGHSAQYLVG